jgi:small GTP-binding protein
MPETPNDFTTINFSVARKIFRELMKDTTLDINPELEEQVEADFFFPDDSRFLWKIVLVGDGAVGKTSIRRRFIGHGFDPVYSSTIGADFSTHSLKMGLRNIKYQIWDLAGQPKFSEVRQPFYAGAKGALIVYDITNRNSFKNIKNWIHEVWQHGKRGPIPFILIANKMDLHESMVKIVPKPYADHLVRKYDKESRENYGFGISLLETSARTGENIKKAFQLLSIQIAVQNRIKKLRTQSR